MDFSILSWKVVKNISTTALFFATKSWFNNITENSAHFQKSSVGPRYPDGSVLFKTRRSRLWPALAVTSPPSRYLRQTSHFASALTRRFRFWSASCLRKRPTFWFVCFWASDSGQLFWARAPHTGGWVQPAASPWEARGLVPFWWHCMCLSTYWGIRQGIIPPLAGSMRGRDCEAELPVPKCPLTQWSDSRFTILAWINITLGVTSWWLYDSTVLPAFINWLSSISTSRPFLPTPLPFEHYYEMMDFFNSALTSVLQLSLQCSESPGFDWSPSRLVSVSLRQVLIGFSTPSLISGTTRCPDSYCVFSASILE